MSGRDDRDGSPFDALAARYDAWYDTPIGAWADRHESEAVFRFLALQRGERLLDLGVGTGRYVAAAAREGAKAFGVDASAGMLAVARARALDAPVTLVRAGADRLPFRDRSFDAVLAVTALCFASDPGLMVAEAARVLRPGGRMVIGELNRRSLWTVVRRMEGLVRPTTYQSAHFRSLDELEALLLAAGLIPVRWEGLLHLPPVNRAGFLGALAPLERFGRRRLPSFGAFLAIDARKPGSRH